MIGPRPGTLKEAIMLIFCMLILHARTYIRKELAQAAVSRIRY